MLVSVVTPSLPSWSIAYCSSFRAASTSGNGQGGEVPEPAGVGPADLRPGVVDVPGQRAGGGGVAEADAG